MALFGCAAGQDEWDAFAGGESSAARKPATDDDWTSGFGTSSNGAGHTSSFSDPFGQLSGPASAPPAPSHSMVRVCALLLIPFIRLLRILGLLAQKLAREPCTVNSGLWCSHIGYKHTLAIIICLLGTKHPQFVWKIALL